MIKILYKLFLAIMIALFIGFGISVFYPGPKALEYPTQLNQPVPANGYTAAQQKIQDDYNSKQKSFQVDFEHYNRNISVILLSASIIILMISLTLLINIEIFGDGVLLGGLITLIYGISRGIMSNDNKFQFIAVTVGLITAIILGFLKFIHPNKVQPKS